ncbi:MAG: hypothetical protein HQL23_04670 [Candidatus Omnitrophica bacterium]|nr:hypothetical protein [Candidatus Omnitrophota bacterium]
MIRKNKILGLVLSCGLIFQQSGFAQMAGALDLPGSIAAFRATLIQENFRPLHLRSMEYNGVDNHFRLLIDKGDLKNPLTSDVENTTKTLLNYFFVGLTLPNKSFWVNLKPDAPDRIIDPYLAQTDVGKIVLESDLQLKKDTAKFTSPDMPEGKEYWSKLYKKAGQLFGDQDIAIPTMTRPWIVPGEIILRETQSPANAYIYKATLKVMLEQDYLKDSNTYNFIDPRLKQLNEYASQLLRELVIPKLTKAVNTAPRYAALRQVYYSLILAQWFKSRYAGQAGLYSSRIDLRDLNGLLSPNPWSPQTYFEQYKKSFQNGEYNLDQTVGEGEDLTVRNYLSGGCVFAIAFPLPSASPVTRGAVTVLPGAAAAFPASGNNISVSFADGAVKILTVDSVVTDQLAPVAFALAARNSRPSDKRDTLAQGSSPLTEPAIIQGETIPVVSILYPAYVRHDLAVKSLVNPQDRNLVGVYGGSGADVTNYLLSTNARESYFVYYAEFGDVSPAELQKVTQKFAVSWEFSQQYQQWKSVKGFGNTGAVFPETFVQALAMELDALRERSIDPYPLDS